MRTALVALILSLFTLAAAPGGGTAQTGAAAGTVTERQTGRVLPAATVRVVGAPTLSTLSASDGRYLLRGLPVGTHMVEATFIGYATVTRQATIRAGETTSIDFELSVEAVQLSPIEVFGSATRGQAFALQRQKTAPNISNVVSEELFNRFPDRNAAETLRRLPGISVDRDQGEGEFVQIRGIDQAFNSLTVNGIRIPAPDEGGGQRSVGLDLINNNLLGEIEVVKAITPNMDGDAVGGVVNFGLRSAPAGGMGRISVGAGLNDQTSAFDAYGNEILDVSSVWANRFSDNRLGVLVDGAWFRTSRQSKLREFDYVGLTETIEGQHTNDYDLVRDRFGFSSTLDYDISPTSRIYARGSYNVYLDNEVRREAEFLLEDEREIRETRNRVEDQRLRLFMAGGESDLGAVQVEYKGAWIQATEELPDRTYLRYRRDNPFTGLRNEDAKNLDGTSTFTGLAPATLDRIRFDDMIKDDADLSGQIDFTVPFGFADGSSAFQFGGKLLRKNVSYERVRYQITDFTRTETLAEGSFGFEDQRFDDPAVAALFTDRGNPRNVTEDYEATEDIGALYAMATLNLSERFTALLGARWENTSTDFLQPNPETADTPLRGEGGYSNLLPSVHLTFRPNDNSNVRMAYSTGLARPSYELLIPRRVVDEDDREISYGNPDLEPRTADNFDLLFERFTPSLGVVTLGTFYKRFRAFQTTRVFDEIVDGQTFRATQPIQGDDIAEYFGIEASFNQPLSLLASSLEGFRLFGNYNYTWSQGEVAGRTLQLTNSPEHTGNLSVLYDNARLGFSFVAAANYRDALLIGVGDSPLEDIYFDDEVTVDFSVVKTISNRLSVSAQLNGLTAQQEREVLGNPGEAGSRLLQFEEYGPYGTINLQYSFR